MSRDRREGGQTAAEYLGLIVVVAAIVAAVMGSDLGGRVACGLEGAVARIAGTDDGPGCGGAQAPAPAPTAAPTTVPIDTAPVSPTPLPTDPLPSPTAYPQEPPAPEQQPVPPRPQEGEPTQEIPDGWEPNGCGSAGGTDVPDAPLGFDFTAQCNAHDTCYKEQRGRDYCDGRLRGDLYSRCAEEPFLKRGTCFWAAKTYADFVALLGGDAYEAAEND